MNHITQRHIAPYDDTSTDLITKFLPQVVHQQSIQHHMQKIPMGALKEFITPSNAATDPAVFCDWHSHLSPCNPSQTRISNGKLTIATYNPIGVQNKKLISHMTSLTLSSTHNNQPDCNTHCTMVPTTKISSLVQQHQTNCYFGPHVGAKLCM